MQWLEVCIKVEPELAEAVADVLSRYAPGGVACEQITLDLSGPAWQPDGPLEPLVTVRAYVPFGPGLDARRRQIEEALWHLGQIRPLPPPAFGVVDEEAWADAWKEHFHVTRIGRFVIKPSWREYVPQANDVLIELDPGQAFGTGLHPTTHMCLLALEAHLAPGANVLDLGTGSGILAIAAARLGAAHVLALDIDPLAVEVAQANVLANGVGETVSVARGSIKEAVSDQPSAVSDQLSAAGPQPPALTCNFQPLTFNLILVNILARVIVELFGQGLGQVLAPGGVMVLAGLIDTQEEEVQAALTAAGLHVIQRLHITDWVTLVCGVEKPGF